MKTLIIIILISIIISVNCDIKISKCSRREDIAADREVEKLTFILNAKSPKNENEMNVLCNALRKNLNNLEKYAKTCFESVPKQIMVTVVYSMKASQRRYCRKGNFNSPLMKEFLHLWECSDTVRPKIIGCNKEFINDVVFVEKWQNITNKIPPLCCAYYKTRECFLKSVEKSSCGKDAAQVAERLLDGVTQGLDLACGNIDDSSDRCKKYSFGKVKRVTVRTPLFPMIKIIAEMGSENGRF